MKSTNCQSFQIAQYKGTNYIEWTRDEISLIFTKATQAWHWVEYGFDEDKQDWVEENRGEGRETCPCSELRDLPLYA